MPMGMNDPESGMDMAGAVTAALSYPAASYTVASDTPQFVILSFDGSKSLTMLQETLDFQKMLQAQGTSLQFTYFINAAYFLTDATGMIYHAPRQKAGVSNIGFSNTALDIPLRVALFNAAHSAGNEIASHSAGHFNGSRWSYSEWRDEFRQFNSILFHVAENNPSIKVDPWLIGPDDIVGFRAPDLGVDQALYLALHDSHFTYDASGVARGDAWPKKDTYGVWRIPLGTIYLGTHHTPVIAMDYSIWAVQSDNNDTVRQGSAEWNSYLSDVKSAYMEYFDHNYNSTRAPIIIADHFSKWNDGVYWEAMKAFAQEVCGKPHVRCVTFSELVQYLDTVGAPKAQ